MVGNIKKSNSMTDKIRMNNSNSNDFILNVAKQQSDAVKSLYETAFKQIEEIRIWPKKFNLHFFWLRSAKIKDCLDKISLEHGYIDKFNMLKRSMMFISNFYDEMLKYDKEVDENNLGIYFERFKSFVLYYYSTIDILTYLYKRIVENNQKKSYNVKDSYNSYLNAEYNAFLKDRLKVEQDKIIGKYLGAIINIIRNFYTHADSTVKMSLHKNEPKLSFEFDPNDRLIRLYFSDAIKLILLEDYKYLKTENPEVESLWFVPNRQSTLSQWHIPIVCKVYELGKKVKLVSFGGNILFLMNSFIFYFIRYIRAFIKCSIGEELIEL